MLTRLCRPALALLLHHAGKSVIMETTNEQAAKDGVLEKEPAKELQCLRIFIGKWRVFGKNFSVVPGGGETTVHGEDNYAWLAGNFYVIGSWQHLFLEGGHIGLAVMGFDEEEKKLFTRKFDNLGYERRYTLEIEGNTWKYIGDKERATRIFMNEGTAYAENWEMKNK